MAYVPPSLKPPGTEIEIDIRGRRAKAVVVPLPFYKREKTSANHDALILIHRS